MLPPLVFARDGICNMANELFRYFKIGEAVVKVKYNDLGIKCVYQFDKTKKEFVINNLFINDIVKNDDVHALKKEEFDAIIASF